MKTKHSANGEVAVEGSQREMEVLSKKINYFVSSEEKVMNLELETNYDPSPYEKALKNLIFMKESENSVVEKEGKLWLAGKDDFSISIAENLPFKVDELPYHIHYDFISFPQFLNPEAPEIVFVATH